MQKAYERINWENHPSEKTPVNEENLNKIDAALDEVDDRVIKIDLTKLDKTSASGMMTGFALNTETGVITLTYYDGSKKTLNTNLAKIALNITYDAENERLVLAMPDGSKTYVDMSALITQYEFIESDIIYFTVTADGKVKADIKDYSIPETKLRPNFLADIKAESSKAAASATSASTSASNAAVSEVNAEASAKRAEQAAQTAQEVTNITYASKDRAGIVKPKDVYVNPEDGSMEFTARTATGLLQPSHAGGIRLHSISAVEDRQVRTTGAQLMNADSLIGVTSVNFTLITDFVPFMEGEYVFCVEFAGGATGVTIYLRDENGDAVVNSQTTDAQVKFTLTAEDATKIKQIVILPYDYNVGLAYETLTLNAGTEALPQEKYTGGKPSPAPGEPVVTSANQLKLNGTTQTVNGVNYAPDTANGFIALVGESTVDTVLTIGTAKLEAGTYYASISGNPQGAIGAFYTFNIKDADGTVLASQGKESADYSYAEFEFTLTESQTVTYEIELGAGEVMDNELAPMIATTSGATFDAYTVEYTEGYPQKIEGTVMKNLLDCRGLTEQTYSGGGKITPVYDAEGNLLYAEANGYFSATASFRVDMSHAVTSGSYILSGCPSGGSTSTYSLRATRGLYGRDVGSGITSDYTVGESLYIYIEIASGYTANALRFYPMIRPASILDDTYVPFGCMRVVGKGKNLLKNILTSQAIHGVTLTVNDDKSVRVVGTGTTNNDVAIASKRTYPLGEYIQSGGIVTFEYLSDGSTWFQTIDGDRTFEVTDASHIFKSVIWVTSGRTYDTTLYPMIRPATVTDDTYEPYVEQSTILSKPFSTFHNIGGEGDKVTPEAEVRRFATVVFDGSEEWVLEQNMFTHPLSVQAKAYKSALCDKFICAFSYNDCNWTDGSFAVSDKYLRVNASGIDFVDEWKAYLAQHPMTVVYELATEQVTPLPTADQIALHSLKSYDGVTHLYTDTYPQMVIDCEWGTSKVGALSLENSELHAVNEIMRAELQAKTDELTEQVSKSLTEEDFTFVDGKLTLNWL